MAAAIVIITCFNGASLQGLPGLQVVRKWGLAPLWSSEGRRREDGSSGVWKEAGIFEEEPGSETMGLRVRRLYLHAASLWAFHVLLLSGWRIGGCRPRECQDIDSSYLSKAGEKAEQAAGCAMGVRVGRLLAKQLDLLCVQDDGLILGC